MRHENGRRTFSRAIGSLAFVATLLAGGCAGDLRARVQPPSVHGKPYLRLSGRVEGFNVWVVDGRYVRENLDEEFTNFGEHFEFPFIPASEFWLDEENSPGEERFFIDHLLLEWRLMARGSDYDSALEQADKAERSERLETPAAREGNSLLAGHRIQDLVARVHKGVLEDWGTGVKVWIVDGELVRDVLFIDFTEGGHDKVYDFIPSGEIWIDDDVRPEERRFILLHELHERGLMSAGWTYARAHRDSSRLEFHYRHHPGGLDAALRAEILKNGRLKT
jgi:hypothetical protein